MIDPIERQAAIDAFKPYADYESNRTNADWVRRIELVLHDLPPAQPEKRTEERTETHACDLISRQAAIDAHYEYCNKHPDAGFPVWSLKILEDLPSAQPELETVKCIIGESCMDIGDADFSMKCAKCGAEYYHVEYYDYNYNFCPNCGRRWRKQGG